MSVTVAMPHAGGIAVGGLFGLQMRRGTDITAPLNRTLDYIANMLRPKTSRDDPWRRSHTSASPPPPRRNVEDVIEKIRRSGYASLSDDEKRRFFDFTNRRN